MPVVVPRIEIEFGELAPSDPAGEEMAVRLRRVATSKMVKSLPAEKVTIGVFRMVVGSGYTKSAATALAADPIAIAVSTPYGPNCL